MAQWGQGQQGFQYPMQTGFPGQNPQFQQQNPQFQAQNPQFQQQQPQFQQQNPQFQQGGFGQINNGGMAPQPTGFPGQRPQGFQQPQQTGFQSGAGFIQQQPTGFVGGNFQPQQARPPPVPPVPQIPSQFQQQNQAGNFLSLPPPQQQPNRFLSPSPAMGGPGLAAQPTGFAGRPSMGPLVPQMTGFVDPRLQMMSSTFMPLNMSSPYSAGGAPQLAPQQNLQQSIQQHNEEQRGAASQQLPWALTKQEQKNYNNIFRSWDAQNTGFINGSTALEVFGQSGLAKDDLARIWTLADIDDRGKLNRAEFHVAMGLIYRRLNGMPIPDQLPQELVPPSARDLDKSVDIVKDLLKHETRNRSPSSFETPVSRLKNRSFNSSSSSLESGRDATIYKHSDSEPPGGFYKPRSRHIDRDAVRPTNDDDSPAADLSDMKRQLANTAQMLDRAAEADAARTAEDEELDREMDDLKYRVKRVQDDLDYVSRGPKTHAKDEERRRLERELLSLLHERVPEVERKIKARDERKEREKRQWARDRDRANDRFGRFDTKDDSYSPRRFDDRDRPYSRGYDRDERDDRSYRPDSRNDRDRERDRDRDRDRERDYERTRSPLTRSPPPFPPTGSASSARDPPVAPPPPKATASPAPTKNMTAEERQAFARAEAQRRIQARMAALGVTAPSSALDTSVEDRLQQEKKEAEEKARAAEKQAEERERLRKERLENEKAAKDVKTTPAPPTPTPTTTATAPTPTAPPPAPTPRFAPPVTKTRAPAPPPPRKAAVAPPRVVATPPAPKPPAPPAAPVVDPEEERLRAREEAIRKQREERAARLRELEKEEEEAARLEEERYQARVQALKAKAAKSPSPPPAPASVPPAPAPVVAAPEKSTNPFSRLLKEGGNVTPPAVTNITTPPNGTSNPWAKPAPISAPLPSKSPVPTAVKASYNTAPPDPDDDWNDLIENSDDDDSSDDEITKSRATRANIAQQLFGSILPRSTSAAGQGSTPVTQANATSPPPPPPPAPPAPVAPPPPTAPPAPIAAPRAAPAVGDVSALMQSIQGGMRLKPTKTVDKSAPPVSGRVLGDTAPPAHINTAPRPVSPPQTALPETIPMSSESTSYSNNRQSVDWFSNRAADAGTLPVERLASTAEDSEGEVYETPSEIPEIHVNDTGPAAESNLMADIDKSIENRVRTLYAFEGDGPDDLSFGENLVLKANPSKSGGEWWFGTTVTNGKSGLFPKAYVEVFKPKKAKAKYTYTESNPDELPFTEGDILSIVDSNEEEWWKAEQGGLIFIVPAAYLEIVEVVDRQIISKPTPTEGSSSANTHLPSTDAPSPRNHSTSRRTVDSDVSDDKSDSDYLSFNESDDEQEGLNSPEEREAREHERQLVLEAAGLIFQQNVGPPPAKLGRKRSVHAGNPARRPAPAAPHRISAVSSTSSTSTSASQSKRLPPVPEPEPIDHVQQLDDAFARYESFRNNQGNLNRLSVLSTDSSITSTVPSSPTTTTSAPSFAPSQNQSHEGRYSQFLNNFLGRNKTPDGERRSTLQISAPIINHSGSGGGTPDVPSRSGTPFGASWASLVDNTALEGIPLNERKRQEAIFELINTEIAYVRDLQLIVELFYRSLLPLLSEKEVTVIFANIEDLLLTNTGFVSSLEERQKECRLYIDRIGDILKAHVPNMGVYMEYCVNQSTAIKVLQSRRESNSELASHLQRLRDEPTARNLDLSSYLLAPMQRITRYPLLLKQILHYTEPGEERHTIELAITTSENLLDHINEAIRDQEGRETLMRISQNLWIGQGRLDLSAPTRYMGSRRLLKEGALVKAKSGRKLFGFLCSDILVLTDESVKTLYRMPIPLAHAQVKDLPSGKDDLAFQVAQPYPRGGDTIVLRASSVRDCQLWIQEIEKAIRRARHAEERAMRKGGRR